MKKNRRIEKRFWDFDKILYVKWTLSPNFTKYFLDFCLFSETIYHWKIKPVFHNFQISWRDFPAFPLPTLLFNVVDVIRDVLLFARKENYYKSYLLADFSQSRMKVQVQWLIVGFLARKTTILWLTFHSLGRQVFSRIGSSSRWACVGQHIGPRSGPRTTQRFPKSFHKIIENAGEKQWKIIFEKFL